MMQKGSGKKVFNFWTEIENYENFKEGTIGLPTVYH